ncbi:MAG: GtrA family protein [Thermoprotei archaeon]
MVSQKTGLRKGAESVALSEQVGDTAVAYSSLETLRSSLYQASQAGRSKVLVLFSKSITQLEEVCKRVEDGSVTFFVNKSLYSRWVNGALRFAFNLGKGSSPMCFGLGMPAALAKSLASRKEDGLGLLLQICASDGEHAFKTVYVPGERPSSGLNLLFKRSVLSSTLLRFVQVGLSGVLVNTVVLAAQVQLFAARPVLAVPLAFEVSVIWNFIFNSKYTFNSQARNLVRFLLYNGSSIGSFVTQTASEYLLNQVLGFNYIGSALVGILAGFFLNYSLSLKIWRKEKTFS